MCVVTKIGLIDSVREMVPSGDGGHLSKRVLEGLRGFGLWEDKGSGGHFCGLDNVLIFYFLFFFNVLIFELSIF